MHAPDGFLNAGTAVATGAVSMGTVGLAFRQARHVLEDRQVPLAGIAAAFVFAAQMFNFPVAAGTTGHLLGGALAAILLGPHMGAIVVTIVVVVQALVFADGGLTALGYNVLNMAVVPAYGGYAIFRLFRRLGPATPGGVISATGLAALVSVVFSAMSFAIQWLFGATAPVSFADVFGAMVGVHFLIGVGEGVISAMLIGAVMASRPDLVHGASDLDRSLPGFRDHRVPMRTFVIGGVVAALLFGAVISQFAAGDPDGLQRVAVEEGFADRARDHSLGDGIFANYATAGLENETLSLAIAGAAGTVIALSVGWGIFHAARARKPPSEVSA